MFVCIPHNTQVAAAGGSLGARVSRRWKHAGRQWLAGSGLGGSEHLRKAVEEAAGERGENTYECGNCGFRRTGTAPIVPPDKPARRSLTCVSRKPADYRPSGRKSRFRVSCEPTPWGGFNRWSVRAVSFAGAQMFFASTQNRDRLQEEWRHPQFGYTRCTPDFGPFLCFSSSHEARLFNRVHMFAVARIRGP